MKAPLGEVMRRRIGYLKNIIMDKVEDLEPPLAHVIPELTSNLLLPLAIFVWMLALAYGTFDFDCSCVGYDSDVLPYEKL